MQSSKYRIASSAELLTGRLLRKLRHPSLNYNPNILQRNAHLVLRKY